MKKEYYDIFNGINHIFVYCHKNLGLILRLDDLYLIKIENC